MNARDEERNAYNFRMVDIYNFNTDKIEAADYWLSQGEEIIIKLRYSLQNESKNYGCPICKTRVGLSRSKKGNYFFRHKKRKEDVPCSLVDENMPRNQKRIQEYNYAKESQEHIDLKNFLYKYLKINSDVIGEPDIEKTVKGTKLPTDWKWKRPDVKCTYKEHEFVFEVQISNTWLSDIVDRDRFYQNEEKVIVWIFNSFNSCKPTEDLTKADIFYNNPEVNLFVLDEDARIETEKSKELTFKCYYRVPYPNFETQKIEEEWRHDFVTLEDFIIDEESGKPYVFSYYDKYDEAANLLEEEGRRIAEEAILRRMRGQQAENERIAREQEKLRLEKVEKKRREEEERLEEERLEKEQEAEDERQREKRRVELDQWRKKQEELWARHAEIEKAMKEEERLKKEELERLAAIEEAKKEEERKRIEANKIENRCPKEFSEMPAKDCVDLVFQNRLSRNLPNLNKRIDDLRELGFMLPSNVIVIMEERGWIERLNENLSLIHYQRGSDLSKFAKSA